jgi:Uma2 family endonuclease
MGAIEFPTPFKLTTDQYHRMGEAGVFPSGARVELIDGTVYEMPPIGNPHASVVRRLQHVFSRRLSDRSVVSIQLPVVLPPHSEPEPDVVLLGWKDDFYSSRAPGADDVLLAIEVASSSLRFDRTVKAALYARFGIAEYWLVDVAARAIVVHRQPAPSGYVDVHELTGESSITPLAFPDCAFNLQELIG